MQIKGQSIENIPQEGKTRMWLSNRTISDIEVIKSNVKGRYRGLYKYEIVEHCVNFFKETGHNPVTFKEESVTKVLERVKKEIVTSNEDLMEENKLFKKQLLRIIKEQGKIVFTPAIIELKNATTLFAQHLKKETPFDPNIRRNEKQEKEEKTQEWLSNFKTEIAVQRAEKETIACEKKNEELLIKNERLSSENQRLIEQLKFIKSKIQTKKSVLGGTQYIVDLDEIELDDFLKK